MRELDQAVRVLDENHYHPRMVGGNRITETGWSFVYRVIKITSRSEDEVAGLMEIPDAVELQALTPGGNASGEREGPVRIKGHFAGVGVSCVCSGRISQWKREGPGFALRLRLRRAKSGSAY